MAVKFALLDGKLVAEHKPHLRLLDSAYLYGIGAFETLRVVAGRVLFVEEHLQRLKNTLRFLHLPLSLKPQEFKKGAAKLLRANGLKDAYLRMMVSGEEQHLGTGGGTKAMAPLHWSLLVRPFSGYPPHLHQQGARLVLIRSVRNDPQPMAQAKVTNYLTKMIARRECASRKPGSGKADEGVLLSPDGKVTECTSSNLFVVKNGKLITPPLTDGLMPGVTRKVLFRLCRKLKIPFVEESLWPADLTRADEIFITSTLKDVMPIGRCEGKRVGRTLPGPITKKLMEAYHHIIAL